MKQFIKGNGWLLFATITFSLLANIALVLTSKQSEWLFDALSAKDVERFTEVIILAIGYIFIIGGLFYIYLVCSRKLIKKVLAKLREKSFAGIMQKDMKTYYQQNTSEYISVLTNDINLIEENWMKPMLGVCESIGMFVTTVVMLVYYSPWITLTIFATSALAFLIPNAMGKYLSKRQQGLSNELAAFTNKVKNIFSGFDVIHSFNMLLHINKNFATYNEQLAQRKYEADHFKVMNDTIGQVLGITIQIGTSCLSAYLVLKGEISIGVLAAVMQLCARFVTPLMSMMNSMSLIKSMKPIIQKFDELSHVPERMVGKQPHFNEGITVSQMSFGYDEHPVLTDINLLIQPTRKYAIMGESGCGKSTLVKLLLGYYTGFTGSIRYDDENVLELDAFALNEMVSIIQQNVYMFDETVRYNICLQQEYSEQSLVAAAQKSGCLKMLTEELNLLTKVGENGANLSGGQRQRIAIARALIRNTPILVLDEGTSAVDMQSAYEIEDNLLAIRELTLFSILHKTSEALLQRYDEIIYMNSGRIVEQGSFAELMAAKAAFYEFYTIAD
ncbi:MAG: ABC transporter ATP-binding protein [Christensenellaceae bacterium]